MIDAYPINTVQILLDKMQPYIAEGISLYAVLEHSFEPKLIHKLKQQITWISLYQDRGAPDADVCPILCQIDTSTSAILEKQLGLLLQATNGWPMLSLWLSSWDRERVFTHFDHYFDVTILPEKLSYVLRYADTRVLPNLLSVLTAEQRAHFFQPFIELVYFDRAAQAVNLLPTQQPIEVSTPLLLDESQFAAMLDAAMPDQILQQCLRMNLMTQLPSQPSQAYALIQQYCLQANQQGLFDFSAVMAYSLEQLFELDDSTT